MSWTTQRTRHSREDHHYGDAEAPVYLLAYALGADLPAGATLEEAIEELDTRLSRIETVDIRVSSFTVSSWIGTTFFHVDAILEATLPADFTVDAYLVAGTGTVSDSFPADAIVAKTLASSFTIDTIIMPFFTVDAIVMPSFTVDAWIGDFSGEESTLGDMTLGDNTLGG